MAGLLLEDGFVIVTTPPSRDLEILHDRMPAILPPKQVGAWLDAPWPAARSLLRPAPEGLLSATPLTSRINSPAHDDPACLTPLCPEPQGLAGGPMGGGAAPRP